MFMRLFLSPDCAAVGRDWKGESSRSAVCVKEKELDGTAISAKKEFRFANGVLMDNFFRLYYGQSEMIL